MNKIIKDRSLFFYSHSLNIMDKFIYHMKRICAFLLLLLCFSYKVSYCTVFKIVLTGGPCAGKTKSLNSIKEKFENEGKKVFTINETATELKSEGLDFDDNANLDIQEKIFRRQLENEETAISGAEKNNDSSDIFIICDRGLLDGKAYMGEEDYAKMIEKFGFSEEGLLKRYDLVIYLQSLSVGIPELFENESNICRQSSLGQAQILDEKVKNIWGKHPNFREIPTFEMFEDKFKELISILEKFISNQNMPITRNSKFLGL